MEMEIEVLLGSVAARTVVRRHPRAHAFPVGDVLAVASPTARVVQLDARGTLLWQLFDGEADLGTLALELAAEFDASVELVLGDLCNFVAGLLENQLVIDEAVGDPVPLPTPDDVGLRPVSVPSPCCGSRLLDHPFLPTVGGRVGSRRIGIRCDDPLIDEAVRALLPEWTTVGDAVPPNISLLFDPPDALGAPPLFSVYVQSDLVGRSPSAQHIRELLGLHLTALSASSSPDRFWLQAWPVGGPEGVVLLGPQLVPALGLLRATIREREWRLAGGYTSISMTVGDVIIDRSAMPVPPGAADRFDRLSEWPHDGPPLLPDGHYPLRAFAVTPPLPDSVADAGPGRPPGGLFDEVRLLQAALPLVGGLEVIGVDRAVGGLLELATRVETDEPAPASLAAWLEGQLR